MSNMAYKKIDVDGAQVQTFIDDSGKFSADMQGDQLESSSLAGLITVIRKSMRKSKVLKIPVTLLDDGYRSAGKLGFTNAYIVGKNSRTNAWLLRSEAGTVLNAHEYRYGGRILDRLTPVEADEMQRLYKEKQAAASAYDKFAANKVAAIDKITAKATKQLEQLDTDKAEEKE